MEWKLAGRALPLDRPLIMGVVNVTPDSFSDGGMLTDPQEAIDHALGLVAAGADLVDVGGESTRPGADPVNVSTEIGRILPVIAAVAECGLVVSVDTTKPEVAEAAMSAGAAIINDTTAAGDPAMRRVMAETGAGVVLMHMQGTPRTMQENPTYRDVVAEVRDFLVERARGAEAAGVPRSSIVVDPGIGFGKTTEHNLELLRRLGELVATGYPVMVGASRKAFLGRITGIDDPSRRDVATAATTALAVAAGAAVCRVHDPGASRQAAEVAWAVSRVRI